MSSIVWDVTTPLGSESANTVDNYLRDSRLGIHDRWRQGGHRSTSGAADGDNDGKHVPVDTAAPPVPSDAGEWSVWDAAGTARQRRFYGSTHATNPNVSEFPGEIRAGSAGTAKMAGVATAAWVRVAVGDVVPAVGYLKRVVYKVPAGSPARSLKRVRMVVGTRPTSSSAQVEVRKAAAPADSVDRFLDASTTAAGSVSLTNASGNFAAESTAAPLPVALAEDDELVLKWISVNGAVDVSVLLQIE